MGCYRRGVKGRQILYDGSMTPGSLHAMEWLFTCSGDFFELLPFNYREISI